MKKQLAVLLGLQRFPFTDVCEADAAELNPYIGNCQLSECFLALARDLDVMEAKTPEDIYKVLKKR